MGWPISPTDSAAITAALAKPNYIPAGVTQAFLEENRDLAPVQTIIFVGVVVTITLLLRCYARGVLRKDFKLDDWLAVTTMLPYTAFITLSIILIRLGSGRHIQYIQYILPNPTINGTEVLDFVAHILYTCALLLCRLSGLAFYWRFADRTPWMQRSIKSAWVFFCGVFLCQLMFLIFHCLPVTGYWPYAWQVEESARYTCLAWGTVYVTNSGLSLVCDVLLFSIPATLIVRLQKRSMMKKLRLSLLLLPGTFVIAISIVRIDLVIRGQYDPDQSWVYSPFLAVENSEVGSTLFALSVPALKPLFNDLFSKYSPRSPTDMDYTRESNTPRSSDRVWRPHSAEGSAAGSAASIEMKGYHDYARVV